MTEICSGCPLEGTTTPSRTTGVGTKFLVVTDTPRAEDVSHNRVLHPLARGEFVSHMDRVGFTKQDFSFTPAIRCPHDADIYTTKQKTEIGKHCREYLLAEIDRIKPQAILPLGALAAKQVAGRAVQITRSRGRAEFSEDLNATVFPMLSPMQVALYPQNAPIFAADCASLRRLLEHDYDAQAASNAVGGGKYEYIRDLEFLIAQQPEVVAFDTETTSLRWYAPGATILTMQFAIGDGKAYVLPWNHPLDPEKPSARRKDILRKQLRRLLCRPGIKVVSQNAVFDSVMVAAHANVKYRIGGDTLMLATLLDENSHTKGLDMLVKRYFPEMAGFSDFYDSTVDKSKMAECPLDQAFLDYSAGDAYTVYHLHEILLREVSKNKNLRINYDRVVLPALNLFVGLETGGMPVDEDALTVFETQLEHSVAAQYQSLIAQVPKSIKRAHLKGKTDEAGTDIGLKFSRGEFIRDILFYHEDGHKLIPKVFTATTEKLPEPLRVPSTSSKDHLPLFFNDCPFTYELSQYVKDERLLGTNVKGYKKKYIVDGMVRPKYNLHTAVTGRVASMDPNSQNFPKRGPLAVAYRRAFKAPEGCYIVGCDFSQVELRIAAHYANEQVMLQIYRENGDIHKMTAAMVLGVTMEEFLSLPKARMKEGRQKAKSVNFGYLYSMFWKKFKIYAKTQYQVEFTDKEAKATMEGFFKLYPGLATWHQNVRKHVRKHKNIQGITGRIRHLPMIDSPEDWIAQGAERMAINSGVQGASSDLALMALADIHEEIDDQYLTPFGFIHDWAGGVCKKEHLLWAAQTIKRYMEDSSIRLQEYWGVTLKCPLVADASFGANLGDELDLTGLEIEGDYDFSSFAEPEIDSAGVVIRPAVFVPEQSIPPNEGYRTISYYDKAE